MPRAANPRPILALTALVLLGACAGPASVDERLASACRAGDEASCAALDHRALEAEPAEPEVLPADRRFVRSTSVGVGVSGGSSSGVDVGIGIGLGSGDPWGRWGRWGY